MTAFITRDTRVPTLGERLAGYFQRSAFNRANAMLGKDEPQQPAAVIPLHRMGKIDAIVEAARLHCRSRSYPRWVDRTAANFGVMRLRHGASVGGAISSAIVNADFVAAVGRDPDAA